MGEPWPVVAPCYLATASSVSDAFGSCLILWHTLLSNNLSSMHLTCVGPLETGSDVFGLLPAGPGLLVFTDEPLKIIVNRNYQLISVGYLGSVLLIMEGKRLDAPAKNIRWL